MLGVSLQKSLAFGAYGSARSALESVYHAVTGVVPGEDKVLPVVFLAGMAGGAANTLVLTPVDQLKICLQVEERVRSDAMTLRQAARAFTAGHNAFGSEAGVSRTTVARRALRAVYTAWPATLARELPGYALYFTAYEAMSTWRRRNNADWAVPLIGGVAGMLMWAFYYPLDAIKSRTMARVASTAAMLGSAPRSSPTSQALREQLKWRTIAREAYLENGIRTFYIGFLPAILRAFPTHAAVFVAYEFVLGSATFLKEKSEAW